MRTLEELRQELNAIDDAILNLLEQRFQVTDEVAVVKNAAGAPLTDPAREEELIRRLKKQARHPALREYIADIYTGIIELNKKARLFNREAAVPYRKIGIIGIGFIGGSIVKGLKAKPNPPRVATVKRDSTDIMYGLSHGYIDTVHETLEELIRHVDLIILATPISATYELAESIASTAQSVRREEPLTVIDVCSVKEKIAAAFQKLTTGTVQFVPTHPMAGSEKTGFANAEAMVFVGKPWALCPHKTNERKTIESVRNFIQALGSPVIEISPKEHDADVASVSHLVFLVSTYLFAYCSTMHRPALRLAGSGLESITRLASGSPEMHTDIVLQNYENIAVSVVEFINFVKEHGLSRQDLLTFFRETKTRRDEFIASRAG